jgi:chromosome segregation ATPase
MSETVEKVTLQDRLRYCVADATPTERRRAELQAADAIDELTSQLETLGTQIAQHESLAHGYTDEIADLQCRVEEARRKAIEEAAQNSSAGSSLDEPPFCEGDRVETCKGYLWPGIVVSVFKTTKGEWRYVVEFTAGAVKGALHIYNADQLRRIQ